MSPLWVSYYTDAAYRRWAHEKLIPSLEAFGLAYEVDPVPDLGSWPRNNQYKADFIQRKLDTHPGQDIVWIDADAEVVERPGLILDADPVDDVAVHYWPHTFDNLPQLWGGTILLRNFAATRGLVALWIQENRKLPLEIDQANLQAVLGRHPEVHVRVLPAGYCWVEEVMRPSEPREAVVIRHFHAARERWMRRTS